MTTTDTTADLTAAIAAADPAEIARTAATLRQAITDTRLVLIANTLDDADLTALNALVMAQGATEAAHKVARDRQREIIRLTEALDDACNRYAKAEAQAARLQAEVDMTAPLLARAAEDATKRRTEVAELEAKVRAADAARLDAELEATATRQGLRQMKRPTIG